MPKKTISSIKNRHKTKEQIAAEKADEEFKKLIEDDGTTSEVQWIVVLEDGTEHKSYIKEVNKEEYVSLVSNIMKACSGDQGVRMAISETDYVTIGAMKMLKAQVFTKVIRAGFGEDFPY